ncbi:translation initiation factor eIF 4e-like domain-containing protein [Rhizophagus diaphanus]|nr:translation initiation factor eIF 4e-like domain-containing protein [Rhizophagus diaphanus] [Rhizophagus sp. MUCL 43196]
MSSSTTSNANTLPTNSTTKSSVVNSKSQTTDSWKNNSLRSSKEKEYEENLKSVATVNTVQSFWSVYNNIIGPDQLQFRSSLHFMKSGIRPVWEDPHNENGGAWSFRVNKSESKIVWRELLMLLIGEQFEDVVSKDDDIFGLSVSTRFNADIFTIWNKNAGAHENSKIMDKLQELLLQENIKLQSPYYKVHKEHAAFKKQDTNGKD